MVEKCTTGAIKSNLPVHNAQRRFTYCIIRKKKAYHYFGRTTSTIIALPFRRRVVWLPKFELLSNKFGIWYENWYEGYAPHTPTTNNALESTNKRLKQDETLRNRLPLPRFLSLAQEVLEKWSIERDPANRECKKFALRPSKSTAVWTKAFQWVSMEKRVLSKARPNDRRWRDYYIPSDGQELDLPAAIRDYRAAFANLQWFSFEDYATMRARLWVVSMFQNSWQTARCNCPIFMKEFICKHSLGVAVREGFCAVPRIAQTVPIGQKRKRGRPRYASAALVRD